MKEQVEELSEQELEAMEARVRAAAPEPWEETTLGGSPAVVAGDGEEWVLPSAAMRQVDVNFVTHARQDVPKLIAEVRRLRSRHSS